jgi:hypothetical protein
VNQLVAANLPAFTTRTSGRGMQLSKAVFSSDTRSVDRESTGGTAEQIRAAEGSGSSAVEDRKTQLAQARGLVNRGDRSDFAMPDPQIEDAEQPPAWGHDDSY